jgi:hypothetical protein
MDMTDEITANLLMLPRPFALPPPFAEPPPFDLDMMDGDWLVGRITPTTIGFGGYATADEAVHAAWVAHSALVRFVDQGHRPYSMHIETDADTCGFVLDVPSLDEVSARLKAIVIYREMRRSGHLAARRQHA